MAIQTESAKANSTASLPRSSHIPPFSYTSLLMNLRSEDEMLFERSISVTTRPQAELPGDVYRGRKTGVPEDSTVRASHRDIHVSDIVVCAVWGRSAGFYRRRPVGALASIYGCCSDS